jgi:uncharacterized membrane protein
LKIAVDKKLHFIAGLVICLIGAWIISPMIGLLLAFVAGGAKEVYDSFYPLEHTVDKYDFLWTVIGGIVGLLGVYSWMYLK